MQVPTVAALQLARKKGRPQRLNEQFLMEVKSCQSRTKKPSTSLDLPKLNDTNQAQL